MGKIVGQIGLFNLGTVTSLAEGKLNSNLLNSTQKIDLVSYPACAEEFVNTYKNAVA